MRPKKLWKINGNDALQMLSDRSRIGSARLLEDGSYDINLPGDDGVSWWGSPDEALDSALTTLDQEAARLEDELAELAERISHLKDIKAAS